MFVRTLTIALLLSILPSIGMAGVVYDATQFSQCSVSSSSDADETPETDCPQRLNTARNTLGMTVNSVTPVSSSSIAIGGWPVLFVKAIPHIESRFGFEEWLFVPDSPLSRIPKVPIV